jgi:Skp family chaperone for outer membrane proteins
MKYRMFVAALALGAVALPLSAQGAPRGGGGGGRAQAAAGTPQERAELERRVRENFAAEVKKRLQLTDDQMTKLTATNQRLDAQRRQLFQQEREARVALRTELASAEGSVNQPRVAELLDTLLRLQRSRLDLVEREQRELSAFLTPVQRARYQAFGDFVQRRMDDMDGRNGGRGGGMRGGDPARVPPDADGRVGKRPPPTPPPAR